MYKRLLKDNPEEKDYMFRLLRTNVYYYKANPTSAIKEEIEKLNNKILTFTSIDDLTLAGYTYCLICLKNDSTMSRLKIPDCFLDICRKLMAQPDLPKAEMNDISRWCSYVSTDLIIKREFPEALRAAQLGLLSDSANAEARIVLPLAYIFNNQSDKAAVIINKFKDKSLTGYKNFKSYGEAYRVSIEVLSDRAITHPDFDKVKELLKN